VNKLSKTLLLTAVLLLAVSPARCFADTARVAHNVELAGDIAGTWHVEPDHNPRAGEPAKVWIALTRKGGEVLPLAQTDCQLAVFSQPYTEGEQPLLQPELKAIEVEQYQGIPGADVVFPQPGLYEMELSCTPKETGSFTAFEMRSNVTVVAGAPSPSPAAENLVGSAEGVDEPQGTNWLEAGGVAIGIAVAVAVWSLLRRKA
jgi:hypothetical protein